MRSFYSGLSIPSRGLALFVALVLLGLPSTGFAQASFKRGDIDGDGCVTGSDFALWKKAFFGGIIPVDAPCRDAYDFNDDGLPVCHRN
jgi:hypothetical protein